MREPRIFLLAQFDEATDRKLAALYGELAGAGLTGIQTQGIPYHFTMGSFPLKRRDEVLERAQAVCLATSAFDIHLSHVGLFGQKVLFVAPSWNVELLSLYKALDPGASVNGCHNWVAHATILMDTPDNISAATPIAAQHFSPFPARIESIGIYEFFPKKFISEYKLIL